MQVIITLTMNPAIDKSACVDRVVPEQKLRCKPPRHEPGGGGINVSRAIHKLGGETIAFYTAGGPTGEMLKELLEKEAINHRPISIMHWTRENFVALEEATGQQFRFGFPGPRLQHSEWQQCLEVLSSLDPKPAYIVASGSLPSGVPDDFYAQVAHLARELDARMILDASGEALHMAADAGVYLLKPNRRELGALVGRDLKDEDDRKTAAMDIVNSGKSEVVVLSLGSEGALMASADGCVQLSAPPVPVESKVGAGDSMVAGIILGLVRGKSLREAVLFGVAAGTAAVMTPGTELCRREDTERLYAQVTAEGV